MAVQLPIPVRFEDVFPAGAYVLGVEPINDLKQARAGFGGGPHPWPDVHPPGRHGVATLRHSRSPRRLPGCRP